MRTYSLSHLPDATLLRDLAALVARDRALTAALLAHLAEVDARKLYLPAAYPSMYAYCVGELRLSEEAAFKRIHAARVARKFPALFEAIADGRLHLSGVILLAPHLTPENAEELLADAAHRSKADIERLLARRFPRPEVPERVEAVAPPASTLTLQPPARDEHAPGRVDTWVGRSKVAPLSAESYALHVTIDQETHDLLRYAQALLGHRVRAGEVAPVLRRALQLLVRQLERRKFAACRRPRRRTPRESRSPRHIPAAVKRAVWERDRGQCTFVSEAGHRCPARTRLEFDHVDPVARGGQATVAGIRLRCRPHNQYGAEQVYGAAFMKEKREAAQRAAVGRRAGEDEIVPWLRALGFRADEARAGAAQCANLPGASLEERVRVALATLAPRHRRGYPTAGAS